MQEIMPGFDFGKDKLDSTVLVEEGNYSQGDFVIYSLLELYLRCSEKVVFVASQQSFAHYSAVMKKLVSTRYFH